MIISYFEIDVFCEGLYSFNFNLTLKFFLTYVILLEKRELNK